MGTTAAPFVAVWAVPGQLHDVYEGYTGLGDRWKAGGGTVEGYHGFVNDWGSRASSGVQAAGTIGMLLDGAAVGLGGRVGPPRAPTAYSVAFEAQISPTGAGTRAAHFRAANEMLLADMAADSGFAASMRRLGIEVPTTKGGLPIGESPKGWTWHHDPKNPGGMQLVRTPEHQGSALQPLLHPGGVGGFKLWGAEY